VIFNMTERENGLENGKQMRALQPHEMFVSQRYATTVYRSELALRLGKLYYELERGKHGQPEIKGYTKEYLEAPSPRREQSKTISGNKESTELRRHRSRPTILATARNYFRLETSYSGTASWPHSTGTRRTASSPRRANMSGRSSSAGSRPGEFREVSHVGAGRQYTTAVMVRMEREIVGRMQEGNRRDYSDPMLVSLHVRIATEDRHPELNVSQRQAVDEIFFRARRLSA
jgi:TrwC relaxase